MRFPEVSWQFEVATEPLVGAAGFGVDVVQVARRRLLRKGWNLAICLTALRSAHLWPRCGQLARSRQAPWPRETTWSDTVTDKQGEGVGMDERSIRVAELLHEAAETHHQVFRITDGADDDWASWYAEWLVRLSELPELVGAKVVRSELTYLLVRLDKEYTERRPAERWEDYYARELVQHFGPS
jgi:hypothetical protein